jgi:hypothetical protein
MTEGCREVTREGCQLSCETKHLVLDPSECPRWASVCRPRVEHAAGEVSRAEPVPSRIE